VTVSRAALLTGYSEKAINQKIDKLVWMEGHQWHKAPDGHRLIDLQGYEKWVEGHPVQFSRAAKKSASNSIGKGAG
jgi:hypothetical protein